MCCENKDSSGFKIRLISYKANVRFCRWGICIKPLKAKIALSNEASLKGRFVASPRIKGMSRLCSCAIFSASLSMAGVRSIPVIF